MVKYQISPYLQTVRHPATGLAMVYHALYGNPRILNEEGIKLLNLFSSPTDLRSIIAQCDDDPSEVVEDFIRNMFVVEHGKDEKARLMEQREHHLDEVRGRETIDRMGLAISDSCNFGCSHCIHFQPSSDNRVLPEYQRAMPMLNMTWETAKKCVDQYVAIMRENGQTECKIHFGNAEPLINWKVIEQVLVYCTDMKDLHFTFAINTNLVLMTEEIARLFKRYKVRIATSLDGVREANDAIRLTKGGRGTFDAIMEKIKLLKDINYPLNGFSITVTKGNYHLIDESVVDLAVDNGMDSLAFDFDMVGLVHIPVAERVEKLMKLKRYANRHGVDFMGTWDSPYRNLVSASLLDQVHAFCAAVQGKSLEFGVDGAIKVCGHTTTRVGSLDNFDGMFQDGGGLLGMVKDRFPGVDEYCSGCKIEGPCGGQCHVTREVVSRATDNTEYRLMVDMCDFYRAVTEALILEALETEAQVSV